MKPILATPIDDKYSLHIVKEHPTKEIDPYVVYFSLVRFNYECPINIRSCSECPVKKLCVDDEEERLGDILLTYFPDIKQTHPEFFL